MFTKKRILRIFKSLWGGYPEAHRVVRDGGPRSPARGRRPAGAELVTVGRGQKCLWGLEIPRLKRLPR